MSRTCKALSQKGENGSLAKARRWKMREQEKAGQTAEALVGLRTVEAPVAFLELGIAPAPANLCRMRFL